MTHLAYVVDAVVSFSGVSAHEHEGQHAIVDAWRMYEIWYETV